MPCRFRPRPAPALIGSLALLLALSIGVVGPSAPLDAAEGLPSERASFHSLQSPSFRVVGDVSPRKIVEIAERLETFRAALATLKPNAPAGTSVPIVVLPFANERALRPYLYLDGRPVKDFSGLYIPSRWGNYLVFDSTAGDDPLTTVYSGFIHFFVGEYFPSAPLWLRRGLAEYYETFRVTPGAIEVGRPHENHLRRLAQGWRIPVARLVAIDRESPEYRDRDQLGTYTSHCWALVHYLIVGNRELETRLPGLLDRLDRGESLDAALQASMGFGAAELEKRLKLYSKQPLFPYLSWKVGEIAVPAVGAPVEIGRGEALALLGEYLVHADAGPAARLHLDAALALEPDNGDALALLASLEAAAGDPAAAEKLYGRATAPTARLRRPASALLAGQFALERARADGASSEAGRERIARARAAAARALELDPDSGEAHALEGRGALEAGDATTALVALTQAQNRMPGRADVVYDRYRAAVQAGQPVVARGIAAGPLARLDARSADQAVRYLDERAQTETANRVGDEVERAMNEGRYDDALAAAREGAAKATDPRLRESLAAKVASLETWIADKRRVDEYNRAVGLVNGGRYREAAAALDALLADCPETQAVCGGARSLREQLTEFEKRR